MVRFGLFRSKVKIIVNKNSILFCFWYKMVSSGVIFDSIIDLLIVV